MKLTRCYIHQFGSLREQRFDFEDGVTLIKGSNESGKSTLHTALAVLLFGLERGRGRAAANDTYKRNLPWKDPEIYGGELDWEREGVHIHTERDFASTPPASYILETKGSSTREIRAEEQPLPPSLTPFLYYNTLSFRQPGSATSDGLANELRSHIVNLQGSGNETLDVGAALQNLLTERKALAKRIDPEAEPSAREIEAQLRQLEVLKETAPGDDWDQLKQEIDTREAQIDRLSIERGSAVRECKRRAAALQEQGITDKSEVQAHLEMAEALEKNQRIYEQDYAKTRLKPGFFSVLSVVLMIPLLLLFWLAVRNLLDGGRFWPLFGAGLVLVTVIEIRLARRLDAESASRTNKEILSRLLGIYLPGHTPRGSASEAGQLKNYLQKVLSVFDYLEEQEAHIRQLTEQLIGLSAEQKSLGGRLESNMTGKIRQENLIRQERELEDEREALQPVLQENEQLREEIRAVDLAISTLDRLSRTVYSDFGEPLTETASGIFREITGGRYDGVRVDEKMQLFAVRDHRLILPSALSGGAAEQLYMAFRLAVIRLLWPDEPMPLFFDESFAFYDRERLQALLRWLTEHYRGQVFLFTCQDREETLLREAGIPFRKIELESGKLALS
ncbi:MAG: AAA family ATPase [Lachnospiraceae bacterium]|nr:AAA family ATPase [Lachnospiraceae bacterium]